MNKQTVWNVFASLWLEMYAFILETLQLPLVSKRLSNRVKSLRVEAAEAGKNIRDRKLLKLLVLMFLLTVLASLVIVPTIPLANASDLTFSSSTNDGMLYYYQTDYEDTRTRSNGIAEDETADVYLGQKNSTFYFVYRAALIFDTSTIPDTATITGATISLYVFDDQSDTDFNVTIQNGQPTYPHDPLENGDYYYLHYSGDGGSRNTSTIGGAGYWNITFSATGLTWVNKTTTTKLVLRSTNDIDDVAPFGDEYFWFFGAEYSEGACASKLYVTYTVAEEDLYSYTFYGPFDEDTGLALEQNVTVNVWSMEGGAFDQFTLNQTYIYNVSTLVQFFQFDFEDNTTRQYWVDPSESNSSTIYVFWTDSTSYVINFVDTTSILSNYPFVTAKRYVNGSLYTVEKRKVDEYQSITMNLLNGRTYQIQLGNEDVTYIFGDLLMTSSTAVQLTLRGVEFPKQTLLTQKYVRVYAYRNTTCVTVFFEDTKEETTNVAVTIEYADFTSAYNYSSSSQTFTLQWTSADPDYSYVVIVTVTHESFGTLTFKQILARDSAVAAPPFGLAWLGQWGFESSFLLPAFLILCVAGCFSALNAEVGAVLMCITAIILTYIGWIPIPSGSLVTAITLAVLMALIYHKRRGGVG